MPWRLSASEPAATASSHSAARTDLILRLATLRRELAAWAAWMADRARPETERRGVPRPTTDVEALNAVHAQLVEELERLGVVTSDEGVSRQGPPAGPCYDERAPQQGKETRP